MKLVFHDLGVEKHLASVPSIRYGGGLKVQSASFTMDETLILEEGQVLTGVIDMKSDDDMEMNTFTVEDFLRYELNNTEERCTLLLTQDPVPVPPPEPEPPTPEEILASAKAGRDQQITSACESAIYNGIDVTTEYGDEHFTLSESDKIMLLGINVMVQAGATSYPYHSMNSTTGTNNICRVYSDADIAKIAVATFSHVTFHESYANMLIQWLNRETDPEVVYGIEYGAVLPQDLMDYLAMILAAAGLPAEMIPGYPTGSDQATEETTETEDGTTDAESAEGETEVTTEEETSAEEEAATEGTDPVEDPAVE